MDKKKRDLFDSKCREWWGFSFKDLIGADFETKSKAMDQWIKKNKKLKAQEVKKD